MEFKVQLGVIDGIARCRASFGNLSILRHHATLRSGRGRARQTQLRVHRAGLLGDRPVLARPTDGQPRLPSLLIAVHSTRRHVTVCGGATVSLTRCGCACVRRAQTAAAHTTHHHKRVIVINY